MSQTLNESVAGRDSSDSSSSASFVSANSSDFGGGSAGSQCSSAPTLSAPSTPPLPSHEGMEHPQGTYECNCDCRVNRNLYTFSPKTCMEIIRAGLLTDKQIDFERKYMKSIGIDIDTRCRITTSKAALLRALETELSYHNCIMTARNVQAVNKLTSNISYICDTSEEAVRRVRRILPQVPATAQRSVPDQDANAVQTSRTVEEVTLDESVCRVFDADSVDFSDITVDHVLGQLDVSTPASHGRITAYFGSTSYSYGPIRHEANSYPESGIFTTLEDRMKRALPDFNLSDYTCLVTLYPDGSSQIKAHSDNESQILPNTNIYTVSVGAQRKLTFLNQVGVINETSVIIPSGSLYSMSRSSQSLWKHAILPDPSVSEPRISFTFRRLIPEAEVPRRERPPPITRPGQHRPPPPQPQRPVTQPGTHGGILLLTDSILAPVPEQIFNRVQGHRCIKKQNKQLINIFNFEGEFSYRDVVVFSCGVNDLSRYGIRGQELSDRIAYRLLDCCHRNPGTTFVFNSVLYTRHDWLNEEIDILNRNMFELSVDCQNLLFFDSSAVLTDHPMSLHVDNVIDPGDRNDCYHLCELTRDL